MHQIRSMEAHLKNTWQFDKWGFTSGMGDLITLSDVDGFYAYYLETGYKFLMVEMKHWDGTGQAPYINERSGQAIALRHLSHQRNFTVLFGYGDTSTQAIHAAQVWKNGKVYNVDFKDALETWWGRYRSERQ